MAPRVFGGRLPKASMEMHAMSETWIPLACVILAALLLAAVVV